MLFTYLLYTVATFIVVIVFLVPIVLKVVQYNLSIYAHD